MERYACESVDRWFTPDAVLQSWIGVWSVASAATGHPFEPDTDLTGFRAEAEALEVEYGHDVAAACEALRNRLKASGQSDAARWLHYGLCSSDIVDAGASIRLAAVDAILVDLTAAATGAISELAHSDEPVVYRTHGQAARVGAGGYRWKGIANGLRAASMYRSGPPALLGFNGPVGTGGVLGPGTAAEIARSIGKVRGLRGFDGVQTDNRAEWSRWLSGVANLATACERFALTVRLLAATGVDEVSEGRPATYRGSSSMPHKRNPTRSERICGLAPVIRGLARGYEEAVSSNWDAHSLEHSSADRVVIPQVCELVGFVLTETADIADSLEFDHEAIVRNVGAAPPDSFALRNDLIEKGFDGGEAWSVAREYSHGVEESIKPRDLTEIVGRTGAEASEAWAEAARLAGDSAEAAGLTSAAVAIAEEAAAMSSPAEEEPPIQIAFEPSVQTSDGSCAECGHPRDIHFLKVGGCGVRAPACSCKAYRRA